MSSREVPDGKVLELDATPGFRGWGHFFTRESVTHPAKMNLNLLRWILETYTEPGEVVLDPMAGTGSTIILASILGRHGIAVELEPRFCDMIRANIELTEKQTTLIPKGRMTCIQGDARELSKLLGESDAIVTSPPYSECEHDYKHGLKVLGDNFKGRRAWEGRERSELSEQNIGRLPHGDIDSIITSPPFGPSQTGGGIFKEGYKKPGEEEISDPGLPQRHGRPLSEDPRNIDNLPYGESVDAVITSPPYEGSIPAQDEKWLEEHWDDESESPKHKTMRFGRSMKGYPKKVDAVITSPPYTSEQFASGQKDRLEYFAKVGGIGHTRHISKQTYEIGIVPEDKHGFMATKEEREEWANSANIGRMAYSRHTGLETYLGAMLIVYKECWKVLKPDGGKFIVVIKNFIRNKAVVRLDLDTIRLCEAAGFRLADRWYFKLPTRSFWRILYSKKFPDVPEVRYEDVLVFEKHITQSLAWPPSSSSSTLGLLPASSSRGEPSLLSSSRTA